ncbi:MAG: hypothetical protein PVI90_03895 [Desulfobacteraceae bacterium]
MPSKRHLPHFSSSQIVTVNHSVAIAEELVSNHYKMSASQWLHPKYDVKTLEELSPEEVVNGPFAQVVRYVGLRKDTTLGSNAYDFYKICLQDHSILNALKTDQKLKLMPFCLYIVCHELIHIVRFSKFLQSFDASPEEKLKEETRVHDGTHHILRPLNIPGLDFVLNYYQKWREPIEGLMDP